MHVGREPVHAGWLKTISIIADDQTLVHHIVTTSINRLATAFSISLASKSFNAAEGAMARSEALEAAVLANGIFGKGERGREAYEIVKFKSPLEYKHWLVAFNDTMRITSSVSMTNHAFIVAN